MINIFYELAEFNGNSYVFRFDDGRFINIDLSVSFPNYKLPESNLGSQVWHFTAVKNYGNQDVNLGDIKLFKRDIVRKYNTLCAKYSYNNVLYRKSTQTELDKYESKLEPITDNGKLYLYIENIINIENDNIENDNIENDNIENDNIQNDNIENDNIENDNIKNILKSITKPYLETLV